MKRYDMVGMTRCGEAWQELEEHDDGDYVLYSDHLAAIAEKDKIIAALKEWKEEVLMWKKDCLDFSEKQQCRCGWNVGFMLPFGATVRIQENEKEIAALKDDYHHLAFEIKLYLSDGISRNRLEKTIQKVIKEAT